MTWRRVLAASFLSIAALLCAHAGDDLPIRPPVFKPKKRKGNKGPGLEPPPAPPPEQPPQEGDPRDTPPPVFWGEEITEARSRVVYVLDRSGSMTQPFTGYVVRHRQWNHPSRGTVTTMTEWAQSGTQKGGGWTGSSRWERAQIETIASIDGLASNIEFQVLVFSTSTQGCFGSMVPATPPNKGKARSWILEQSPGGGTCTAPAVAAGLRLRPDACVLLTDGIPECYHPDIIGNHRAAIRVKNTRPIPIRVFGIGVSRAARAFCQGVASDSGGTYTEPSR